MRWRFQVILACMKINSQHITFFLFSRGPFLCSICQVVIFYAFALLAMPRHWSCLFFWDVLNGLFFYRCTHNLSLFQIFVYCWMQLRSDMRRQGSETLNKWPTVATVFANNFSFLSTYQESCVSAFMPCCAFHVAACGIYYFFFFSLWLPCKVRY